MNNMSLFSSAATLAQTSTSPRYDLKDDKYYAARVSYTNTTPSAGTFTAAITDICTKAAHGMGLGLKVQVSSTTTLPGGLASTTDYFVIPLSASTFSLASSLVNANAGVAIDLTTTGTGTHTITPTALSATVKLQTSIDGINWTDVGTPTAVSATGSKEWADGTAPCVFPFLQSVLTVTAGQVTLAANIVSK